MLLLETEQGLKYSFVASVSCEAADEKHPLKMKGHSEPRLQKLLVGSCYCCMSVLRIYVINPLCQTAGPHFISCPL